MSERSRAILLVEDNADDELLTVRSLRSSLSDSEIVVARDGQQALDFLFRGEDDEGPTQLPDVVLLDIKLPRVSGLRVLRRIRDEERTRLLPVVILTSSSQEADLAASYAGGANSYVRKPVEARQFAEAIERVGRYWLLSNEPPPAARS